MIQTSIEQLRIVLDRVLEEIGEQEVERIREHIKKEFSEEYVQELRKKTDDFLRSLNKPKDVASFCEEHRITESQFYGREWMGGHDWGFVTEIPDGFSPKVRGNLDLSGLKAIPNGFNPRVRGNLWLDSVKDVPERFSPKVGYTISLRSVTKLTSAFNPQSLNPRDIPDPVMVILSKQAFPLMEKSLSDIFGDNIPFKAEFVGDIPEKSETQDSSPDKNRVLLKCRDKPIGVTIPEYITLSGPLPKITDRISLCLLEALSNSNADLTPCAIDVTASSILGAYMCNVTAVKNDSTRRICFTVTAIDED